MGTTVARRRTSVSNVGRFPTYEVIAVGRLFDIFLRGGKDSYPELDVKKVLKLKKVGVDPYSLSPREREAAAAELRFQAAMKKFKEPNVGFGKQKSKKYLRAYWKNRAIQEKLVRDCFNEFEVQVDQILGSIPQSALKDPEVQAYLKEAIHELRSLEKRFR